MKIETVLISDLHTDPSNARTHSEKNSKAIASSLKKFGQQKPIVIGTDNVVIAGNGTLQAAIDLGWNEIKCVRSALTGAEAIAYSIADNRTQDLSEFDNEILGQHLEALAAENWNLDELGFDADDLDELLPKPEVTGLTDDDAVPENVETICKKGDLWQLGDHRLLCGDSTKKEDVERLMGGEKADMVFTDPPYGLGDKKSFNKNHKEYKDDIAFDLTLLPEFESDFVIWGGNYYDHLPIPRTEIGWIVWDKRPSRESWDQETRAAADRRFGQHFEIAVTNIKGLRGKMLRKTWGGYYGTAGNKDDEIVHKTQKPIALLTECITAKHKIIADLFLGSGSTLIACEKTGRRCFGMEIDEHYCDVIIKRWGEFTGKKAVKLD